MASVWLRVRCWVRAAVPRSVAVVVATATVVAVVLATASGARRTSTAPDRYTASREDLLDVVAQQDSGEPLAAEIRGLPSVQAVELLTFVFGQFLDPGDPDRTVESLVFAGSYVPTGMRLVDGRDVDAAAPSEFVATRGWVREHSLEIGATLPLVTITQEQANELGFDVSDPQGPSLDGTLVGIIDGPSDLSDPTAVAIFSPALLDVGDGPATSGSVMSIGLRNGATTDDLRRELDTLPGGQLVSVDEAEVIPGDVRTAVRAQAIALWLLAAIAAVGSIAVVGQLVARLVRLTQEESATLTALGYTERQIALEAAMRATALAALAVPIGAVVAVAPSGAFPFGFVGRIEPDPGVEVDVVTLGIGAVVMLAGILVWVVVATLPTRRRVGPRRGARIDAVAARCPTGPMATGLRFAFSARSLGTSSIVASIAGTALVVVALAGTLTFGVSLRRFVEDPARYGTNFDYMVDSGAEELPQDVLTTLLAEPAVGAATEYVGGLARAGDSTIAVAGFRTHRGNLVPPLLSGRLPAAADEVALGRRSTRDLDVSVGDSITLTLDETSASYTVTGITIPPGLRGNDIVGHGAVMTADGYARLEREAPVIALAVGLSDDATRADAERLATTFGLTSDTAAPDRPPAVRNVARVTFVPFALAAVLAALVVLSVTNAVWSSIRRQHRQGAVLRSLGAEQRWISSAARWQGAVWTILPLTLGVPLGIISGRVVFRSFARGIGGVDDPTVPLMVMFTSLVGVTTVAVAVATAASHRVRINAPAVTLRTE